MKTKYNFSHLVNKKSPEKDWKKAIHYRYEIVSLTWKNTKLSHFKGFFIIERLGTPKTFVLFICKSHPFIVQNITFWTFK